MTWKPSGNICPKALVVVASIMSWGLQQLPEGPGNSHLAQGWSVPISKEPCLPCSICVEGSSETVSL